MNLVELNNKRWLDCKVNPNKQAQFKSVAERLTLPENVKRFKEVEKETKVPWWFVAVVKEREAGSDPKFTKNIAQGDSWSRVSTHVPAGRGPFKSWEEAAVDALTKCAPYAAKNTDWSPGGALTMLEKYNGLGYYNKGIPSPYIWAGTNQYTKGKYVADGIFDPNHVDTQLGCAGLLKEMNVFKKEPSIVAPVAVGMGGFALMWHWLVQHPAVAVVAGVVIAITIYGLINKFRKNKNVQLDQTKI